MRSCGVRAPAIWARAFAIAVKTPSSCLAYPFTVSTRFGIRSERRCNAESTSENEKGRDRVYAELQQGIAIGQHRRRGLAQSQQARPQLIFDLRAPVPKVDLDAVNDVAPEQHFSPLGHVMEFDGETVGRRAD